MKTCGQNFRYGSWTKLVLKRCFTSYLLERGERNETDKNTNRSGYRARSCWKYHYFDTIGVEGNQNWAGNFRCGGTRAFNHSVYCLENKEYSPEARSIYTQCVKLCGFGKALIRGGTSKCRWMPKSLAETEPVLMTCNVANQKTILLLSKDSIAVNATAIGLQSVSAHNRWKEKKPFTW